jgi:hypothetical protein
MGDTKNKTTQVRGHNESKTNAVANIQYPIQEKTMQQVRTKSNATHASIGRAGNEQKGTCRNASWHRPIVREMVAEKKI